MILFYIFIILILYLTFCNCERPSTFPPGPRWWPFVGNIPLVVRKLKEVKLHHLVWADLVKVFGPIVGLKLGNEKVVIVSGKELIKEVSNREEFEGRPDGFFWRMRNNGKRLGLVFVDGPFWREQRRFVLHHLKRFGLGRSIMEDLINDEAIALVEWLKTTKGSPIETDDIFDVHVLNVIWALFAGQRYKRDNVKLTEVCKAMQRNFKLLDASGGLLHQLPILRFIIPNKCGYTQYVSNHQIMKKFIRENIEEHKKTIQHGIDRDLIDAFLHKVESESDPNSSFTEDQLGGLCLDFLLAGTDTTSNTLQFFVSYMIQNPDVQKRAQREIDTIIGRSGYVNLDDRVRMPYVSALSLEIHRIGSVAASGIPHRALVNTNLGGYVIPKDTTILLMLYNVNMDEHWEDPFAFKPERFLDNNEELIVDDWFAPFGYGKRKCIGENLAKANLFIFCIYLLQNFDILLDPNNQSKSHMEIANGIASAPKSFQSIWRLRV